MLPYCPLYKEITHEAGHQKLDKDLLLIWQWNYAVQYVGHITFQAKAALYIVVKKLF